MCYWFISPFRQKCPRYPTEQLAIVEEEQADNEELSLYLNAMADAHGGEGDPDVVESFSGKESMAEIVAIAVGLEKESILFYVGIKDMVPPKFGQDKIDTIIKEETQHVAQLKGFLKKAEKLA